LLFFHTEGKSFNMAIFHAAQSKHIAKASNCSQFALKAFKVRAIPMKDFSLSSFTRKDADDWSAKKQAHS
jgi:hypothetical protein